MCCELNETFSLFLQRIICTLIFFQAKDLVDVVSEAAEKKNRLLEKLIAVTMKVVFFFFLVFLCVLLCSSIFHTFLLSFIGLCLVCLSFTF